MDLTVGSRREADEVKPPRPNDSHQGCGRRELNELEYFARQYEITPAVREEVESGLGKLTKILGENFKSKVILTVEKHRNIAEITVSRRRGHIVDWRRRPTWWRHQSGARTYRDPGAPPQWPPSRYPPQSERQELEGAGGSRGGDPDCRRRQCRYGRAGRGAQVSFDRTHHRGAPGASTDSVAMRPMTIEEAVKECEFRDREVFVFRDRKGKPRCFIAAKTERSS